LIDTSKLTAIKEAQEGQAPVQLSDLVLIGNILKSGEIDTTVVADYNTYIEVNGLINTYNFLGRYVVVGREIVKITSVTQLTTTSKVFVERAQLGTLNSYAIKDDGIDFEINPNYSFRTVTIFDRVNTFDINSNTGNTSDIFSFQVESSTITIDIDSTELKDWNQSLTSRLYNTKSTKTVVYFFRGLNNGVGSRMLVYTGFLKRAYPSSKRGECIVRLDIKDKFVKWNTKEMDKSFEIVNADPKSFFNTVLDISEDMVLYGGGLAESNFRLVSGIYAKEFTTYNDLFDAYFKQGIRFCFDELERIKVFCDFDGLSVVADLEIPMNETNITDISLDPDNALIRNCITSTYKERKPLFDFENDLNGKYKDFKYNIQINDYILISGNNEFNVLTISDDTLFQRTLLSDYVLLKDNLTNLQFYGRVMKKTAPSTTEIVMGRFDKDYILNVYGKYDYLTNLGYNLPRDFTVYFGIVELPLIFEVAFDNASGETLTSNMQIALLPQIENDSTEYVKTFDCTFGDADDLEIGTYSGFFYQISQLYGTWNNSSLLYNRELDQFDGTKPPLGVLTNRATKDRTTNTDTTITYTTFDNSNLQLQVLKSEDTSVDMVLRYKNSQVIQANQLFVDTPTEWLSSTLIKVNSLTEYKVGDVLTIIKPTTWTNITQQNAYSDVSNIRYIISATIDEGVGQRYLVLNNGYPYSTTYPMFSFTRYKYEHIVYLQETYVRGNPVIELDTTVYEKNATSIAEYEKQTYEINGRFYNRYGLTDFIDYMLRGYGGVLEDRSDFKQILPLKVRDHYHVQRGDVIRLKDDIYTGTTSDDLYYVLGVQHSSRSAEMSVWVININKFNADGSSYSLEEKLTYTPIETVYYSYTDSTSDIGSAYIVSTDSSLGNLSLSRISRTDMRADILSIVDNKITFNNFSGNNLTTYRSTIFSTDEKIEFVALIGNEYVYMKSYDNGDFTEITESATIIQRGLFSSTQEEITSDSVVTFYSIIAGTNTEGVLSSTSAFIGTDEDYLKFKPSIGLAVKSKGEVDISNDSNRMYFDPADINNKSQLLLNVDWADENNNVKPVYDGVEFQIGSEISDGYMRYDSSTGLVIRGTLLLEDGSQVAAVLADVNKIYYQNSQPTTSLKIGDLWIDSDSNNKLYVYSGTAFILAQDYYTALTTAQGANTLAQSKILSTYNSRNTTVIGNINYNTTSNEIERYNGTIWQPISNNSMELTTNITNTSTLDLLYSTFIVTPTSDITLTIPSCENYNNKKITIKNMSAFIITINTSNSELIDGTVSTSLTTQYETVRLHSNSVQWIKV